MRYKISHALVQFGGDVILRDVNFEVHDKEKIAIVGRNGCGKTTLLRLIAGDISMNNLDSDEECGITMAGKQEIGFLRQVNFTEKDVTVEEEIKKVFEPVFACEKRMRELENEMKTSADKQLLREYDNLQSRMEAMRGYSWQQDMETMFQRFGFALEDLKRPIRSFSGGQQTKVAFIKLLLKRPDIMLLDEPTNHLDITSKEILESALNRYTGTVLYVSHDRYFINRTATRILDLTGQSFVNYIGNYDYYLEKKEDVEAAFFAGRGSEAPKSALGRPADAGTGASSGTAASSSASDTGAKLDWKAQKEEQARIRKRQNELKKTEDAIHQLETRDSEINELLALEEVYTDVSRLMELNKEKDSISEKLEKLYELWEALAEE